MADETRPEAEESNAAAAITEPLAEEQSEDMEQAEDQGDKLSQTVEMHDVGPCKKHVKVTVDRSSIDGLMDPKCSAATAGCVERKGSGT